MEHLQIPLELVLRKEGLGLGPDVFLHVLSDMCSAFSNGESISISESQARVTTMQYMVFGVLKVPR